MRTNCHQTNEKWMGMVKTGFFKCHARLLTPFDFLQLSTLASAYLNGHDDDETKGRPAGYDWIEFPNENVVIKRKFWKLLGVPFSSGGRRQSSFILQDFCCSFRCHDHLLIALLMEACSVVIHTD